MEQPLDILREYWGYDGFRGIQQEIIDSVLAGQDTLGLMPTGGGKSITFQVPTLCMEGLCVVVTPLSALMKDQVQSLRRRGILASAVYSGMSSDDVESVYDNCILGHTKFLYISPERLVNPLFLTKLRKMRVSLITVDEAHCISQWGYDFRPSYLSINQIRRELRGVPVLALTATATPQVVDDICHQLDFGQDAQIFRMSFERTNLAYVVRKADDKIGEILHILERVPGSAIVYTRSREGTRELAQHLTESGISATHFHAGMTLLDKDLRQRRWQSGETRVMVATNAFGMGIDKPDVRLVVHADLPDSIEAYFQEAGRAGRDGARAWAVLLYNRGDLTKMNRRSDMEFPPKDFCAQIYEELAYFFQLPVGEGAGRTFEFNINQFCRSFRHYPAGVESALQLLTRAGYIVYREEDDGKARLMMLTRRDDLYYMSHLTPLDDRVLRAVLRLYAGLFAEYVYVEEDRIAEEAGLSQQQVYDVLIDLTRQRVLNYVPRKHVPRVTYVLRRVDQERVYFSEDVYETRRQVYQQRVQAMVNYCQTGDECRSVQLLRYFGEERADRCGCCDVCLQK
ncbi:MAG: RecQ family ATP-dependent DNA helicase [Bacteroidaceae bacterium]|nr:RecQ family ATP-dependent DNA helicase [Bacteroidaceae bacterium]